MELAKKYCSYDWSDAKLEVQKKRSLEIHKQTYI